MRLEKDNVPLHHWQSTVQCFIYITIFFIFDFSVQPCQSIVPVAMNIVFFSFLLLLFSSSPRAQHRTNGYSSLFNFFFLFPCCSALIDFGLGQFVVVCLLQPRSNYCRTNSPSTSSLSIHEQKKKITEIDSATWHFVPLYFGLWRYILSYVVYSLTVIQQNEYGRDIWI